MKILEIACHQYRVPFKVPFFSSRGFEAFREGHLVRIRTDTGALGYGEAAPLTGFGTGTLEELGSELIRIGSEMVERSIDEAIQILSSSGSSVWNAPVRFALDTALLDLRSEAEGKSISQFVLPGAAMSVPVNATISEVNLDGAVKAAEYAQMAGYTVIKMKIGSGADMAGEIERTRSVREAIGPGIELRLDINGAWTVEQAIKFARSVEPYDIAYLEQPLPATDVGEMARLRRQISIPIAADESAGTPAAVEELIELEAVDAIIVKPSIIGGISTAREVVRRAQEHGMRTVVTTGLETGVAITAALHLAATLPEPVPACGLATGVLLESDLLVESPMITRGQMTVPVSPGLGVAPEHSVWHKDRTDVTVLRPAGES